LCSSARSLSAYERPPLTKEYLRGESPREKAFVHPDAFYSEHDIKLMTGTAVTALDTSRGRLTLPGGRELRYDRLLLGTGASPRLLSVPGAALDEICYLRTLGDCGMLRERLEHGGKAAVIGAGWLGTEFAASARQRGVEVQPLETRCARCWRGQAARAQVCPGEAPVRSARGAALR
jgi:3-phenylpropionate/trans-cinnamate dioxygenase ferredoxin reductase component